MGSYQILGGSRPFPKEIRPRGATGLVQQVEAVLGRDSTTCSTGCRVPTRLRVVLGFLLVVVDLPSYPDVHSIPLAGLLWRCRSCCCGRWRGRQNAWS